MTTAIAIEIEEVERTEIAAEDHQCTKRKRSSQHVEGLRDPKRIKPWCLGAVTAVRAPSKKYQEHSPPEADLTTDAVMTTLASELSRQEIRGEVVDVMMITMIMTIDQEIVVASVCRSMLALSELANV